MTDVEATPRGVSEVVSTLWKEQPETFKALRQVGHTRHRDDALRPASNVVCDQDLVIETVGVAL